MQKLLILILFSCCASFSSLTFSEEVKAALIDPRTGILLQSFPDDLMFYESWQAPPISAQAKALRKERLVHDLRVVQKALRRFPANFARLYLERVYLLQSLTFYDLSYGGTNDDVTLFLTSAAHYPENFLEKTFYHEFSSILLRAHPEFLDQEAWKRANPKGFRYKGGGVQALLEKAHSLRWEEKYHRQGFLAQYGTASLEEDFNLFSESLFFNNQLFELSQRFPALAKKLELLLDFYARLSPVFTRDFFYHIEKQSFADKATDLSGQADDLFFPYENGFFARLKGDRWLMKKDNFAPVLLKQEKKDAHYLYLRAIKSPHYVGLPLEPGSGYFYAFFFRGKDLYSQKRTKIP